MESDNPFALVVLAAKRSLESREDEEKRFSFKRELVSLMLQKGFSREEILHVFRFLDGILALVDLDKERIIYNEFLSQEVKEVAYVTNFERLAIEKGMLRSARESVVEALEVKFGSVPEDIPTRLQGIEEREVLKQLHRQAILASSLDDFKSHLNN